MFNHSNEQLANMANIVSIATKCSNMTSSELSSYKKSSEYVGLPKLQGVDNYCNYIMYRVTAHLMKHSEAASLLIRLVYNHPVSTSTLRCYLLCEQLG